MQPVATVARSAILTRTEKGFQISSGHFGRVTQFSDPPPSGTQSCEAVMRECSHDDTRIQEVVVNWGGAGFVVSGLIARATCGWQRQRSQKRLQPPRALSAGIRRRFCCDLSSCGRGHVFGSDVRSIKIRQVARILSPTQTLFSPPNTSRRAFLFLKCETGAESARDMSG